MQCEIDQSGKVEQLNTHTIAHKLAWKIHSLKKSVQVKNIKETDILRLWE